MIERPGCMVGVFSWLWLVLCSMWRRISCGIENKKGSINKIVRVACKYLLTVQDHYSWIKIKNKNIFCRQIIESVKKFKTIQVFCFYKYFLLFKACTYISPFLFLYVVTSISTVHFLPNPFSVLSAFPVLQYQFSNVRYPFADHIGHYNFCNDHF